MSQSLHIGLKQSMNLTLSLRQKLNILQMSNIELIETLSQELSKNPFLEDSLQITNDDESYNYNNMHVNSMDDSFDPASLIEDTKSLYAHVTEQIGEIIYDRIEHFIATYLINLLQESGYINLDITLAAKELKTTEELISSVLSKLQSLSPSGIFARNLKECLTIQLKEQNKYTTIFQIILDNLQMIASHDFDKLAKLCNVPKQQLLEHIKIIKSLNPKPCAYFDKDIVSARIPDVVLEIDSAQNITVRANSTSIPNIALNKQYYSELKSHDLTPTDKTFISTEYHNANNIIRSVNQRIKTIIEVAEAIIEKQKDFFTKGVMYLKPLTLSEIASACSMNESTISRATSNKYIKTPTGIYEMKFFFSSSIQSKNNNTSVSSRKVKEIIKSIIDSEEPTNVFSDDDIVSELSKFNIKIARRTVTKYREILGIATSNLRKRIFKNAT
jgi:RNA polymerase sigma-54 factor